MLRTIPLPSDLVGSGLADQGFDSNVDAVLNAGNGFIYVFKQDQYV